MATLNIARQQARKQGINITDKKEISGYSGCHCGRHETRGHNSACRGMVYERGESCDHGGDAQDRPQSSAPLCEDNRPGCLSLGFHCHGSLRKGL